MTSITATPFAAADSFTILIIEDDLIMQQRLQRVVAELGHNAGQKLAHNDVDQNTTTLNIATNRLSALNPQQHNGSTSITQSLKTTQQHDSAAHTTTCFSTCHTLLVNTCTQALHLAQQQQPIHLTLLDLSLPDGHGLELIAPLRQHHPDMTILVVTVCATHDTLLKCIQAGANGYLLKEREDYELAIAIQHALNGAMPIDPFMAAILITLATPSAQTPATAHFDLSLRELEILKWITQGLSNREIALQLSLSRYTIDTHIRNIYAKLAVNNRSKAIAAAQKFQLF